MIRELFNLHELETGDGSEDFHDIFLYAIRPAVQMHGHALFYFLRKFFLQSI